MAIVYQPEPPELLPFKDSPRCPKCQSDKRMKPVYRTYRTVAARVRRRFFSGYRFGTHILQEEHLHMTCAACQFSMDMQCAPVKRPTLLPHEVPEVVVGWESLARR
jgi:hypothetical protein